MVGTMGYVPERRVGPKAGDGPQVSG